MMEKSFRSDSRFISRLGLGLVILLVLLMLPANLTERAEAQQIATPTATIKIPRPLRPQVTLLAPPISITKSVPTFVLLNLSLLDMRSVQLTGETTRTTAAITFEGQFTASINIQSPSSMLLGESRVITLELIPEVQAQAAMVRADLNALNFNVLDDGYPEKTVIMGTPIRWNWGIAPQEAGEQEFFLSLSYINDQGSRVHWQNIPLKMSVSIAASPTGAATAADIDTPTLISYEITLPVTETSIPTWTPTVTAASTATSTITPEATPAFFLTPTDTFSQRVSDDIAENPGSYLATLVTLVLGLLGVYFQYVRKNNKGTGNKP